MIEFVNNQVDLVYSFMDQGPTSLNDTFINVSETHIKLAQYDTNDFLDLHILIFLLHLFHFLFSLIEVTIVEQRVCKRMLIIAGKTSIVYMNI